MSGLFSIDIFGSPDCAIIEESYPLPPIRGALPSKVEPAMERDVVMDWPKEEGVGQFDVASVVPYAVLGIGALASIGIIWWAATPRMRQNRRRRRSYRR